MTTRVTIEVPETANYRVEVSTASQSTLYTQYIDAGTRHDVYLHDDLWVSGIREVAV